MFPEERDSLHPTQMLLWRIDKDLWKVEIIFQEFYNTTFTESLESFWIDDSKRTNWGFVRFTELSKPFFLDAQWVWRHDKRACSSAWARICKFQCVCKTWSRSVALRHSCCTFDQVRSDFPTLNDPNPPHSRENRHPHSNTLTGTKYWLYVHVYWMEEQSRFENPLP